MVDRSGRNRIVERILREVGAPRLIEWLASRLSMTDLQSLLLEVYRRRADGRQPREVMRQYLSNRFVRIANGSPRDALRLDELACSLLPDGFDIVELSPLSPFGTCSALAPVDQNNVVTTIRGTEVCSDSTNVLALESAARRMNITRDESTPDTKLCASQRLVRAQQFSGSASFPHFRVFSLTTAGRTQGNLRAEAAAIGEHIGFYLRLLSESLRIGFPAANLRVELLPLSKAAADAALPDLATALTSRFPGVRTSVSDQASHETDYYVDVRFHIHASNRAGAEYFLVDGGLTTWTRQLLSDRREFLATSGMGTERFVVCFKDASSA